MRPPEEEMERRVEEEVVRKVVDWGVVPKEGLCDVSQVITFVFVIKIIIIVKTIIMSLFHKSREYQVICIIIAFESQ